MLLVLQGKCRPPEMWEQRGESAWQGLDGVAGGVLGALGGSTEKSPGTCSRTGNARQAGDYRRSVSEDRKSRFSSQPVAHVEWEEHTGSESLVMMLSPRPRVHQPRQAAAGLGWSPAVRCLPLWGHWDLECQEPWNAQVL